MVLRLLGRPGRKPTWEQLAEQVRAAFAEHHPDVELTVSDDPAATWVSWRLGPSIQTVQAEVGEVPGWRWAAVEPALDPPLPPPSSEPTLWIRRAFTETALAVGLVRFYGMRSRHLSTADAPRYLGDFAAICDVDDPERSGYPIVDRIVELLLAAPDDPADAAAPTDLDRLSAKLRRLRYETLWAQAYRDLP